MAHRFFLVDVFAERRYSGNQLAVVVGEEWLPDETMQLLAAETNYSETTFLTPVPEEGGGYRVRIFTPAREIAFAGHPILGTATVLRRVLAPESSAPLRGPRGSRRPGHRERRGLSRGLPHGAPARA